MRAFKSLPMAVMQFEHEKYELIWYFILEYENNMTVTPREPYQEASGVS